MANTKSAKKAIRKIRKRTLENLNKRRKLRKDIKQVNNLIEEGKKKEAEKAFQLATKTIDKAAKTHLIHKNTAARYKSRLAKKLNNIEKLAKKPKPAKKAKKRKASKRKK